jgi:hypothetical protein
MGGHTRYQDCGPGTRQPGAAPSDFGGAGFDFSSLSWVPASVLRLGVLTLTAPKHP